MLRAAKKLRGSGSPSALKAYQLRRWITRYDESSEKFRESIVRLIEYLGNKNAEWSKIYALTASRLIALDKCPRVRPISIG